MAGAERLNRARLTHSQVDVAVRLQEIERQSGTAANKTVRFLMRATRAYAAQGKAEKGLRQRPRC